MTKIQKIILSILIVSICISATVCVSIYRAIYINPDQLVIHYETLKDDKIPDELIDQSIVYFTDLQYGKFQNKKRTKKFISKVEHLDPDILLIGGDLFEKSFLPDETDIVYMIDFLKNIPAPLGKFAVLGEQDIADGQRLQILERIYHESEVEILDNASRTIANQSIPSIQIIGMGVDPNWNQALAGVRKEQFNILLSHQPDLLLSPELERAPIDFALAGHSHGTQISYPVYGGYEEIKGAKKLNSKKGEKTPFNYYVSSGVGCTKVNARLNSTPEIVYILLDS